MKPSWPLADDEVHVWVPATSANLGPGFDAMGVAVDLYDEVSVRPAAHLGIEVTGEGSADVPTNESHLVVSSLRHGLVELAYPDPQLGLQVRAHNQIPHSRGLGSSAAAIGAGLALAWGLARPGVPLDREWLLQRLSRLEGHPDNAGAVVYGGAVLAWMDPDQVGLVKLTVQPGLQTAVFVPENTLATAKARRVLPGTLRRAQVIQQACRSALLVHALAEAPEQLLEATKDWLHQEQRASLMPASHRLRLRLRAAGVPAAVSGAGTTIIAIGQPEQLAGIDQVDHAGFRVQRLAVGSGIELLGGR